jgi:Flp pilus assembly protein TadD
MLSCRFAARPGLITGSILALLLHQLSGCAADEPPPPVRSSAHARASGGAPRGAATAPTPAGGSTAATGLGDSALEPAARAAAEAEDWPRAEALYRELCRRQPRNAGAKHGLGLALLRQQKGDQAIGVLQESVRLSDDAGTRLDLAASFESVGRTPSAVPHLRKSVELAPRDPQTWAGLAEALVKVDKPESAAELLSESRKPCVRCPSDDKWNHATDEAARALAAKADRQVGAGDLAGARKAVDVALALRAELVEVQLALGKVARAEGNTQAATGALRKAVEQLPDAKAETGAGARLQLATLLLSGPGGPSPGPDGQEAVKLASQVVEVRADDGAALDTLGRACDATRNTECARKAYAKLAKLPAGGDHQSRGAQEHARQRMKELKRRRR